ncbi:MAG TPA: hypothetical protein VKA26_00175, partial [Ignavibacteriaceae bacterium]|nr:hypothetical protein [Ignavibacteriaceae bacterium]
VNVEGKPKKSEILKIYSPDDEITEVEGGEILKSENGIYTIKIFFPESGERYLRKIIKINLN